VRLYHALTPKQRWRETPQDIQAFNLAFGDGVKLYAAMSQDPSYLAAVEAPDMKLYYATMVQDKGQFPALAQLKPSVLLSYHYYGKYDLDELLCKHFSAPVDVFLDSGAFSAHTLGAEIKEPDYVAFIKRYQHRLGCYAVLDDTRSPENTWDAQRRMEDAGVNPLPVWHVREPLSWLERYLDAGYKRIAVGGMVPFLARPKVLMPKLAQAHLLARGRAGLHGFGATSWTVAQQVPWDSVDSSSWTGCVRFGQLDLFDRRLAKFQKLKLGDRAAWHRCARQLAELGAAPEPFGSWPRGQTLKGPDRIALLALSARSYAAAAAHAGRMHGKGNS